MPTDINMTVLRIALKSFPFFYLSSLIQVLFLAREKCLASNAEDQKETVLLV